MPTLEQLQEADALFQELQNTKKEFNEFKFKSKNEKEQLQLGNIKEVNALSQELQNMKKEFNEFKFKSKNEQEQLKLKQMEKLDEKMQS